MQGVHVDRMPKAKIKFEDYIEQIDAEIKKKKIQVEFNSAFLDGLRRRISNHEDSYI